ncbi:type VI secretion system lipoprotein TssJ [Paraburkholderia aspalathi]|jgi:type VI secretion system protein VasD|uniref:type VI secretion system lipoprotein TssJ n=1 Tax=Paraburkholderia aspalathi TaxID=1324617 RepID=UPI0038BD13D4
MKRQLRIGAAALTVLAVAGCGVGQAVKDSTVDAAKWAFTTQVKTMNMDLVSRSSLNANGAGQSLSTVVRIYQLKTPQAFQQLDYTQLQTNDLTALKADLLVTRDVVLRPDASASISEPMSSDAAYVGVVAFFRDAGKDSSWKLVIPKKQWKKTDPVKIEARDNTLNLVGATDDTIKRNAPQQSAPNLPNPKPAR